MVTIQEYVAEARSWIGTPFQHQCRLKGAGVDCVGSLTGIAKSLGIDVSAVPHNYPTRPKGDYLLEAITKTGLLDREVSNDLFYGAVVVFSLVNSPQHFGLLADYDLGGYSLLHASHPEGFREVPLDHMWLKRLHSVWRLKFVEY